jgi:LemA protein
MRFRNFPFTVTRRASFSLVGNFLSFQTIAMLNISFLIFVVLAVVLLGILAYAVGIYNHLVTLKNRVDNAFSQIEVQLKRRHDLIPNLVETVKGYMSHERETLEAVIQARNQAVGGLQQASAQRGDPAAIEQLAVAERGLGGALGRLFALSEAYPDLKANQNMMQLTEELTSTENRIGFSRQAYNDSVTTYNTYKQTFPPVIFANMFGHSQDRQLLQFDTEKINQAPTVSFN